MFAKICTWILIELLFIIAKNKKQEHIYQKNEWKTVVCSHNGIDTGKKKKTPKTKKLLVKNMDEKQNSYALRNQTKKLHSSNFIYIWFKTGNINIFVTDVRIAFFRGECNYWETLTEIPPVKHSTFCV